MSPKTFTERSKSNRSLIGAVAFGTLGAAVVFVPKVRKAVVGAAGTAFDAIQEKCLDLAAPKPSTPERKPPRSPERPRPRKAEPAPAQRAANATPDPKTAKKARKAPTPRGTKRKGGTTKSTAPGFVNANDQEVVRRAGKSESWKGQYVYELRCLACGHHYGTNGPEIKTRQCPACQDGSDGEPI